MKAILIFGGLLIFITMVFLFVIGGGWLVF
jgi:hypothetical protein